MPVIPRFVHTAVLPVPQEPTVSPGVFSEVSQAQVGIGRAGMAVSQDIAGIARSQQAQEQKELMADRVLKSLKTDGEIRQDVSTYADSLKDRQDYENFEPDTQKYLQSLKDKYLTQAGGDPVLQKAFQLRFNQASVQLMHTARAKKFDVMSKQAQGAFATQYDESLKEYADETNSGHRELIKKNVEIGAAAMVASGYMTPKQEEGYVQGFTDSADSLRADQLIDSNPTTAETELKSGEFKGLAPAIRQQKIEKAKLRQKQVIAADNVIENNRIKQAKQQQKLEHDGEERNLGEAYTKGDYDQIIPLLMHSKNLSGNELAKWTALAKKATTMKDPFKRSDPTFFDQQLQKAVRSGFDNPDAIIPIPGKLSREDAALVQKVAKRALQPTEREVTTLTGDARQTIKEQIKQGSSIFGFSPDTSENSYKALVGLTQTLEREPDLQKRIDMLTPGSSSYIVDKIIAPFKKNGNDLTNAGNLISILRGAPPTTTSAPTLTNLQHNASTGETIGWNSEAGKWVPIKK